MDVGMGELRSSFSEYLGQVREGQTITITKRGRPIARIVPVGVPTTLERLVAEGRVRPPQRRRGTST